MSDPLSSVVPSRGTASATSAPGPARPDAPRSAQSDLVGVGSRIEVQPIRLLSPQVLEVQIRGPEAGGRWGAVTRAELAKPLPASVLQLLATATTSGTARPGAMAVEAEVVAVKPALVLRIIAPDARLTSQSARSLAPGTRDWLGRQLCQHWPQSRPVAATLQNLTARLAAGAGPGTDLAARRSIEQSIASIVDRLAGPGDLTDPQRLAGALAKSGVWLESALAQLAVNPEAVPDLGQDLKAQLLTLAHGVRAAILEDARRSRPDRSSAALPRLEAPGGQRGTTPPHVANGRPSPPADATGADALLHQAAASLRRLAASLGAAAGRPEPGPPGAAAPREDREPHLSAALGRDIEGMIKQIVTNQLQALSSTAAQPHWVLELPFRTPAGLMALEADIKREQAAEASGEESWSMQIRLDLQQLGPLVINLMLRAEQLNASLQAGTEGGAETLKQNLSKLRAQLEARDIRVAGLHAGFRPGERPPPPFDAPLVSEEA